MLIDDDASRTSPGFDTLDPSEIVGDTLRVSQQEHGFSCIRTMLAPNIARVDDEPYTLKFKVATPWKALPGSSSEDGWLTIAWGPGAGPLDVQIIEIDKAGSTPGKWLVFG